MPKSKQKSVLAIKLMARKLLDLLYLNLNRVSNMNSKNSKIPRRLLGRVSNKNSNKKFKNSTKMSKIMRKRIRISKMTTNTLETYAKIKNISK